MTDNYSCGLNSGKITVLEYTNGTWVPFSNYTINAGSCQITFNLHADPILGVFSAAPATTSAAATTVQAVNTTQVVTQPTQNNNGLYIAIVVLVLIAAGYYLFTRKKR